MELRRDNGSNFKMPARADGIVGWKAQDEELFQRSRARDVDRVDQLVKAQ